uniref:Uncharacterized protein n=1 Tax=Anopheles darlingi TaxID=43151 RepID=A0A2M4DLF8_ANODA
MVFFLSSSRFTSAICLRFWDFSCAFCIASAVITFSLYPVGRDMSSSDPGAGSLSVLRSYIALCLAVISFGSLGLIFFSSSSTSSSLPDSIASSQRSSPLDVPLSRPLVRFFFWPFWPASPFSGVGAFEGRSCCESLSGWDTLVSTVLSACSSLVVSSSAMISGSGSASMYSTSSPTSKDSPNV